jgi:cell division protein FtsX
MGLKQILQNFSWETIINLPPSDILALLLIALMAIGLVVAGLASLSRY